MKRMENLLRRALSVLMCICMLTGNVGVSFAEKISPSTGSLDSLYAIPRKDVTVNLMRSENGGEPAMVENKNGNRGIWLLMTDNAAERWRNEDVKRAENTGTPGVYTASMTYTSEYQSLALSTEQSPNANSIVRNGGIFELDANSDNKIDVSERFRVEIDDQDTTAVVKLVNYVKSVPVNVVFKRTDASKPNEGEKDAEFAGYDYNISSLYAVLMDDNGNAVTNVIQLTHTKEGNILSYSGHLYAAADVNCHLALLTLKPHQQFDFNNPNYSADKFNVHDGLTDETRTIPVNMDTEGWNISVYENFVVKMEEDATTGTTIVKLLNEVKTIPVTVEIKAYDEAKQEYTPVAPSNADEPNLYLVYLDAQGNALTNVNKLIKKDTGVYSADVVMAAKDVGTLNLLTLKEHAFYAPAYNADSYNRFYVDNEASSVMSLNSDGNGAVSLVNLNCDGDKNTISMNEFFSLTVTNQEDGSVLVGLVNDRDCALQGLVDTYKNGKLEINEETGSFVNYDGGKYYNELSPLGIAGSFHIVAFDTAYLNAHTNGNVLAKNAVANANFGTNNLPFELSYIQNYQTVSSTSASSENHILALGAGNTLSLSTDGDVVVNGTELGAPKNFIIDQDASHPFIDLAAVEADMRALSSTLASHSSNVGISEDFMDGHTRLTLISNTGAGYYNMRASSLVNFPNAGLELHFSDQNKGSIVINVDCSGMKDVKLPRAKVYINGEEQGIGEVTTFENGKVIWNFINVGPDTTITTHEMTGMIIAPDAHVEMPTNINGTIIAKTTKNSGETHRTDFVGTTIPASGAFSAVKKVNGGTPNENEVFSFVLEEQNADDSWTVLQTKQNSRSTIKFDNITYNKAGVHTYRIREDSSTVPDGYTASDEEYFMEVTVFDNKALGTNALGKSYRFWKKGGTSLSGSDHFVFNNSKEGADLVLIKKDSQNEIYLKGAEFELWKDNEKIRTVTTNDQGRASFANLADGAYTLKEITAPAGYEMPSPNEWTFTKNGDDYSLDTLTNASIANKNELSILNDKKATTTVEGEKIWNDNNNEHGNRPDSITVILLADGVEAKRETVSSADNWKYSFTDLPVKNAEGKDIVYTIQEIAVPGYSSEVNGFNIDNTEETTTVSGEKKWFGDDKYVDKTRPSYVTIRLWEGEGENKTEVASTTANADKNWKYSFTGLPKYRNGQLITYSVTEDPVDGYTSVVVGYDVENTLITTVVKGEKIWDDQNNAHSLRPASITIVLYKTVNGVHSKVAEQTVSADTDPAKNWKWSFTGLPTKELVDGTYYDVTYSVEESPVTGYTSEPVGNDIKNRLNTVKLEGTKTWVGDAESERPESITIWAMDGTQQVKSTTTNAGANWKWEISDLPEYKAVDGNLVKINYTVMEEAVDGYNGGQTVAGVLNSTTGKYEITNTLDDIEITVTKTWAGNDNHPSSAVVTLLADGIAVVRNDNPITLDDSNIWTYTWSSLPKYNGNTEIVYTVGEVDAEGKSTVPAGYDVNITGDITNGFNVVNTYNVGETTAQIPVQKTLNVESGDGLEKEGTFTFTLTAEDGTPMPAEGEREVIISLKNEAGQKTASKTGSFGVIEYTKPDTYTYTVIETANVAGVTNDAGASGKTVTVTVTDNGDGTLTAVADSTTSSPLTFTNTYNVEDAKLTLSVDKQLSNPDKKENVPEIDGKYTFTLAPVTEGAPMPTKVTATNTADDNSFGEITYTEAGTYKYQITETGYVPGVTNANAAEVTVVVTDNGEGKLVIEEQNVATKTVTIINIYNDLRDISVEKKWEGKDDHPASIEVTLFAGETKVECANNPVELNDNGWTHTWSDLPKTDENGEEIKYTVREVVVPNGYSSSLTGTMESGYVITNTYSSSSTTVSFPVKKALEKNGLTPDSIAGKFTINLAAVDGAPLPEITSYPITDADGGTVTFGPITYTEADTYKYTITEEGSALGVTNDIMAASGKTVTVTVTDNGDGTLTAVADSTTSSPLTFTNTYNVEDAKLTLSVDKQLSNPDKKENVPEIDGKYTFTLAPVTEGAPMPTKVNATNTMGDNSFGEITYTEPGTYTYQITESGYVPGVTNANTAEVTVVVTDSGEGKLVIEEQNVATKTVTITNTYNDLRDISVEKKWEGKDDHPASVEVTLFAGETKVECDNNPVVLSADNIWTHTWSDLPKTDENGEEIKYTVREVVVPNGYSSSLTGTMESGYVITNTYSTSSTTISIPVQKTLTVESGEGLKTEGAFTFTLTTDEEGTPMPAEDEREITISLMNEAGQTSTSEPHSFGEITYNAPGSYHYKVSEAANNVVAGVTNDPNFTKDVTVEVTDNGNGTLSAKVVHGDEKLNHVPFTNTYNATPTNLAIPFTKTLANGDQNEAARTFTFNLYEVNAGVETTLDTQSVTVQPSDSDARAYTDVAGQFTPIQYTNVGTYTYRVKEVDTATDGVIIYSDIAYTTDAYEVVVEVTDDGKGNLIANPTYTKVGTAGNATIPAFTNTFNPAKTQITVKKVWEGDEQHQTLRPEQITVKLMQSIDGQTPTVYQSETASAPNWEVTFSDLPVKVNKQEATYTVVEELSAADVAKGYKLVSGTWNEDHTVYTLTNRLELVDVTGTKVWEDDSNRDGIRPETVTINLLVDGKTIQTQVLTAADQNGADVNAWKWSFTDLPKYDANGEEIAYDVSETIKYAEGTPVENRYSLKERTGGKLDSGDFEYTLTNKLDYATTDVMVTKKWIDDEDRDGIRPASVQVKLTGTIPDGESTMVVEERTAEVLASDSWQYTFENLPKKAEGKEITYTVEEVGEVTGYIRTVEVGNADNHYTIENTHEVEEIEVQGAKIWEDDNNRDGIRPGSVEIVLTSDLPGFEPVTQLVTPATDETNSWSYTFTGLVKYLKEKDANGKPVPVTYTVTEKVVPVGYTATVSADGLSITNTHNPETVEIKGSKTWVDLDNRYLKRPDSVTINLLADGTEIDSRKVTEADNWSWTFADLPKYKEGEVGKEIAYTITEEAVAGYITTVNGLNVTNTMNLVEFIKLDQQTGRRLPGASFALYEGTVGSYDASKPVETWVSTNDSKILAGLKVGQTYTIVETEAPSGYVMMVPFQFTVQLTDIPGTYRAFSVSNCHVYRFRKLDQATNGLVDGARLAIMDSGDNIIDSWWSSGDNNGWHEIVDSRLVAGVDYRLVELESPWGYELADPIPFSIDENDGYLIINNSKSMSADLVMYDEPWPEVTPTPEPTETSFTVTKRWEDKGNVLGLRPSSITVHLYRKLRTEAEYPTTPFMTVQMASNGDDTWRFTFDDLPRRSDGGVLYDYTVLEEPVEGYVVSYLNNGRTIVNNIPEEDFPPTPTPTLPYVTPTPSPMPRVPAGVQFVDGEWMYIDEYGIPLGGVPVTGDDTNFVLWGMAVGLPLLVAALAAVEIRRRKKLLLAAKNEEEAEETEA